jgi:hypothetical protein
MVAEGIGSRDTPWTIGSVISTAGSVWVRYFLPFVAIAMVATVPSIVFSLVLGRTPSVQSLTTLGIAQFVVSFIVVIFVIVTLTYATVQALRGRRIAIGDSLLQGVRRLPVAVGAGLLAYLGLIVGLVLLVVPGLILFTMWSVSLSVTTVERTGVIASLSRSSSLTRGRRWRVFGTILVPIVLAIAVGAALFGIFGLVGLRSPTAIILGWILGGLERSFGVCVFATLYYFLRREKEGVDIDQIASVFD